MNILIVDDSEITLDLIEMYLESFFDIAPILASSGNQAIKKLQDGLQVDIILSDYNMPDGTGGDLFNYYQKENLLQDFGLITAEPFDILKEFKSINCPEKFVFLQKPYNAEQFFKSFAPLINKNSSQSNEVVKPPEYMKVKINKFIKYMNCSVDLYLKLSDKKIIKVSNRVDKASSEQLSRFKDKGVEFIYLTKDDFQIFIETGLNEVNSKLFKSSGVKLVDTQKDAIEVIHDSMISFGVNAKSIETARNCFEATFSSLKKNDKLKSLIPSFKTGDENFKYSLSVATSYFSIAMGMKVEFCDTASLEKMAMAAIFQDVALNDPKMLKITSTDSEIFKKLSRVDQKNVLNHPSRGVDLIDNATDLTIDVKNIIIQHHERPGENGFPKGLASNNITPLSCIFILANELANRILSSDEIESNLDLIRANFEARYHKGNFKKVFNSFSQVFTQLK